MITVKSLKFFWIERKVTLDFGLVQLKFSAKLLGIMKSLKYVIALMLLAMGGLGFFFYQFSNSALAPSESTKKVEFDLLRGTHPREISQALEKAGIIRSASAFLWLGKFTEGWNGIKAADYELSPSLTPMQIFKIFKSGVGIQHALLVKEGDNIYQVADAFVQAKLLDKKSAIKLFRSPEFIASLGLGDEQIRSLEGYLFPNTYFYDKRESAENLVKRMVDAFLRSWSPEYEARAHELNLSRKQVVILASMIEKETGASFERPMIASVFYNRLKKRMRLQSDPTVIYGIWERYVGKIHKSDLLHPTEYNTYTIPAIPVGAISNPNPESVKAALFPADSDFLYFVSKNDGTHVFSKTYGEHTDWVKKTQLDPKAREGKSWRDLKKKKK